MTTITATAARARCEASSPGLATIASADGPCRVMSDQASLTFIERQYLSLEGRRSIKLAADHLARVIGRSDLTPLDSPLAAYRRGTYEVHGPDLEYQVALVFIAPDAIRYVVTRTDTTSADHVTLTRWRVEVILGECCDELVTLHVDGRSSHNEALRVARTREGTGRYPDRVHSCRTPARSWTSRLLGR